MRMNPSTIAESSTIRSPAMKPGKASPALRTNDSSVFAVQRVNDHTQTTEYVHSD
jgi:hypothetical protein